MNIDPSLGDAMSESIEWERVAHLLGGVCGSNKSERDKVVMALKALDRESTIGVLASMLNSPDAELRCDAAEALLRIDSSQTIGLVLPLLTDPDKVVRWNTCGLMHDFGDKRALQMLAKVLLSDPEGDVRHIAAYALGEIGDISVLPALRRAVEVDDGTDYRGDPVRDVATEAIENILTRR